LKPDSPNPSSKKQNKADRACMWTRNDGSETAIEIRDAPDKLPSTIKNKISRKTNKTTDSNIPWSIKLINDFKRNSVILFTEKDI